MIGESIAVNLTMFKSEFFLLYLNLRMTFWDFRLGTENPDIRFLQVTGNILQSYKYFHDIKPEIRRLMTFSDDIKSLVETYTQTMFKLVFPHKLDKVSWIYREDTKSHKLCVHTRLGDFKTHFLQESTLDFVNPALELLGRELKVSLLFITHYKAY